MGLLQDIAYYLLVALSIGGFALFIFLMICTIIIRRSEKKRNQPIDEALERQREEDKRRRMEKI